MKSTKIRFIHCIYFLLFYSHAALSNEKQIFLLGGGGEPEGKETIFDGDIRMLSRFTNLNQKDWNISHSFDGGHVNTEKMTKQKLSYSKNLGHFNVENLQTTLDTMLSKIKSMHSGDQLMIILDTHGATNDTKNSEISHSISLTGERPINMNTLEGANLMSVDKLSTLTEIADKNGIKLAILDFSCFSGNTLKIARPSTCIISATSEDLTAINDTKEANDNSPYLGFIGRFFERMKKGSNLEDVYLNARSGSSFADFPMISTDIGKEVDDFLYKYIGPYLIHNNESIYNFTELYENEDYEVTICKNNAQYTELKKRLVEISKMSSIANKIIDTSKLKLALNNYRNYQLKFEKALLNSKKASEEMKRFVASKYPDEVGFFEKEDFSILYYKDLNETIDYFNELIKTRKDEYWKETYIKSRDKFIKMQKIIEDVKLNLSPESKKSLSTFENIYQYSTSTENLASKVGAEAKKIYDALYKVQSKASNKSNPCKEFIL